MDMVEVLQVATCRVNPPPSGTLIDSEEAVCQSSRGEGLSKRNIKCDSKQDAGVGRRAWENG